MAKSGIEKAVEALERRCEALEKRPSTLSPKDPTFAALEQRVGNVEASVVAMKPKAKTRGK